MRKITAAIALSSLLVTGAALPSNANEQLRFQPKVKLEKLASKSKFMAQSPNRRENQDIRAIFDNNAKVERLATGLQFTEGPL